MPHTGKDIDVDLQEGSLLHLSGKARDEWNHGVRLGVTKLQLQDFGNSDIDDDDDRVSKGIKLYDWFGSMKSARQRGPERLSIIFAFADPV